VYLFKHILICCGKIRCWGLGEICLLFSVILMGTPAAARQQPYQAVQQPHLKLHSKSRAVRILPPSLPGEESLFAVGDSRPDRATTAFKIGDTFFEAQHLGSMHRQVAWGNSIACPMTIHMGWTYLATAEPIDRAFRYAFFDGVSGTLSTPCNVQPAGEYSSNTCLEVTDDNRAVISGNNNLGTGYLIQTYWQGQCNQSNFPVSSFVPRALTLSGNTCIGDDDAILRPAIAWQEPADGEPVLHVVGTVACLSSEGRSLHYFRKVGHDADGLWTGFVIDTVFVREGCDIAAGPGGKVALAWVARLSDESGCDTCSATGTSGDEYRDLWDTDLYFQINTAYGRGDRGQPYDGVTNFWQPRVNITRNAAGTDGCRPWGDLSTLVTSDDVFHVAFISMVWDDDNFDTHRSHLYHWSEELGFEPGGQPNLRAVSAADWAPENCDPGPSSLNQSKVCLAECDGRLYVVWTEFNSPNTTGNEFHDDCAARAFTGQQEAAANGDLFLAVSGDLSGLLWDKPRAVTDSYGGPSGGVDDPCDPSVGDGCPCENWPSLTAFGSDYPVTLPEPSNVVNLDGDYSGDWYLDVTYIADPDPGSAHQGYGGWYRADYNWLRLPCVEPIEIPSLMLSPNGVAFPQWGHHCQETSIDVYINNPGNAVLTYMVETQEDTGPYSGWLEARDFNLMVSPTAWDTGRVVINAAGTPVCDAGTVVRLTGRLIFSHNAPSETDIFEIDFLIADTLCLPSWDTISTGCLQLTVSNHGNAGHLGLGRVNMDYTPEGNGEWRSDAEVYLGDAATVIGWIDATDTNINTAMYNLPIGNANSLLPLGGGYHETLPWADICHSGLFVNRDSSLAIQATWYAGRDAAFSRGFIIKATKLYAFDGLSHPDILVGEFCDWDIPADSQSVDNDSGPGTDLDPPTQTVVFQQGVEYDGYNDEAETASGGWDESQRYGALYFLSGYVYSGPEQTRSVIEAPDLLYTAANARYVYPYAYGFHPDTLFTLHNRQGEYISDSSHTDLHSGMTYVSNFDLGADDTLYFYTAYLTTMNALWPEASTGTGPGEIAADALAFFLEYLAHDSGCCAVPGDANHDGTADISDLTYFVDFMFADGPEPICPEEFDNDSNCDLDISDLTYFIDFMFGGGPEPMACHTC